MGHHMYSNFVCVCMQDSTACIPSVLLLHPEHWCRRHKRPSSGLCVSHTVASERYVGPVGFWEQWERLHAEATLKFDHYKKKHQDKLTEVSSTEYYKQQSESPLRRKKALRLLKHSRRTLAGTTLAKAWVTESRSPVLRTPSSKHPCKDGRLLTFDYKTENLDFEKRTLALAYNTATLTFVFFSITLLINDSNNNDNHWWWQ